MKENCLLSQGLQYLQLGGKRIGERKYPGSFMILGVPVPTLDGTWSTDFKLQRAVVFKVLPEIQRPRQCLCGWGFGKRGGGVLSLPYNCAGPEGVCVLSPSEAMRGSPCLSFSQNCKPLPVVKPEVVFNWHQKGGLGFPRTPPLPGQNSGVILGIASLPSSSPLPLKWNGAVLFRLVGCDPSVWRTLA